MIRVDVEQGTIEWLTARLGIPTASNGHRIVTEKKGRLSTKSREYLAQLLAEWFLREPFDEHKSAFMARGSELEVESVRWYEFNRDVEVDRVGFCLTDDRRIGCSPDGLVGEDGGLEIKCLSATRHIMAALSEDEDEHRCQIQGALYVTGRSWWDRLYYHPSFPPVVLRVERDDAFIGILSDALGEFNKRLDEERERLLNMGYKRIEPKPVGAWCTHRRDDGRFCMSGAGLIKFKDDQWRCTEHAPSVDDVFGAIAERIAG